MMLRMRAYIALISSPVSKDVEFIEERRLIVVAASPEEAEAAMRRITDPAWTFQMTDEMPRAGYLEAAKLTPGVAKSYNP